MCILYIQRANLSVKNTHVSIRIIATIIAEEREKKSILR